jgi:hypothetical protein
MGEPIVWVLTSRELKKTRDESLESSNIATRALAKVVLGEKEEP